jgi:uroporphyrinogen decarboxylase
MGFKHIYSHICGEQNANLEKWAEIPMGNPGIISIGHEIDVLTAAKYFPNDIILGNLDPSIVQTGTPQEVYDSSKEIIEKGMQCSGGFIFSPGCQMPPKAPAINAWMLTKAAQDFGRYE